MKTTPGYLRVIRVMGVALAAMLSVATMSGCGDNNNGPEVVLSGDNCAQACQRYAACYDSSFNTTDCTNRCAAAVSDSTITVQATEACLQCIGDAACGTPTYTCAAICSAIIVL